MSETIYKKYLIEEHTAREDWNDVESATGSIHNKDGSFDVIYGTDLEDVKTKIDTRTQDDIIHFHFKVLLNNNRIAFIDQCAVQKALTEYNNREYNKAISILQSITNAKNVCKNYLKSLTIHILQMTLHDGPTSIVMYHYAMNNAESNKAQVLSDKLNQEYTGGYSEFAFRLYGYDSIIIRYIYNLGYYEIETDEKGSCYTAKYLGSTENEALKAKRWDILVNLGIIERR